MIRHLVVSQRRQNLKLSYLPLPSLSDTSSPSSVVSEIFNEERCAFQVSDIALTFLKSVQFTYNMKEKNVYKSRCKILKTTGRSLERLHFTAAWIQAFTYEEINPSLVLCPRWKLMPQGYWSLTSCLYNQTMKNLPECNFGSDKTLFRQQTTPNHAS